MGRRPGSKKKADGIDSIAKENMVADGKPIAYSSEAITAITMNGRQSHRYSRKVADDESDYIPEQSTSKIEIQSTINQRPRRSIKHKFIKCASSPVAHEPRVQQTPAPPNLDRQIQSPIISSELVPLIKRIDACTPTKNTNNNFAPETITDGVIALTNNDSVVRQPAKRGRKKKMATMPTELPAEKPVERTGRQTRISHRRSELTVTQSQPMLSEASDNECNALNVIDYDSEARIPTNYVVDEANSVCIVRDDDEFTDNCVNDIIEEIVDDSNIIYVVENTNEDCIVHQEHSYGDEVEVISDEGDSATIILAATDDEDSTTNSMPGSGPTNIDDIGASIHDSENMNEQEPIDVIGYVEALAQTEVCALVEQEVEVVENVEREIEIVEQDVEDVQIVIAQSSSPALSRRRGRPRKSKTLPEPAPIESAYEVEPPEERSATSAEQPVSIGAVDQYPPADGDDECTMEGDIHIVKPDVAVNKITSSIQHIQIGSNECQDSNAVSSDAEMVEHGLDEPPVIERCLDNIDSAWDQHDEVDAMAAMVEISTENKLCSIESMDVGLPATPPVESTLSRSEAADEEKTGELSDHKAGIGPNSCEGSADSEATTALQHSNDVSFKITSEEQHNIVNVIIDNHTVTNCEVEKPSKTNNECNNSLPDNGDIDVKHANSDDIGNAVDLLAFANQNVFESNRPSKMPYKSLTDEETSAVVDRLNTVASDSATMNVELTPMTGVENATSDELVDAKKPRGRPRRKRTDDESNMNKKYQGISTNPGEAAWVTSDTAHNTPRRTTRRSTRGMDTVTDSVSFDADVSSIDVPSVRIEELPLDEIEAEAETDNGDVVAEEISMVENATSPAEVSDDVMQVENEPTVVAISAEIPVVEVLVKTTSEVVNIEKTSIEKSIPMQVSEEVESKEISAAWSVANDMTEADNGDCRILNTNKALPKIPLESFKSQPAQEELKSSEAMSIEDSDYKVNQDSQNKIDPMTFTAVEADKCGVDREVALSSTQPQTTVDIEMSAVKAEGQDAIPYLSEAVGSIRIRDDLLSQLITNQAETSGHTVLTDSQGEDSCFIPTTRNSDQEGVNSPSQVASELLEEVDDTNNRRRSGRIKTIIQSKQRSRGLGVVKDRERYSTSSSIGINDDDTSNTSTDTYPAIAAAEAIPPKSEEQLEKERIDRENGLKLFMSIIDNEHRSERIISKEAKKMSCDCFLTEQEIERGEWGCGDDCLNRMLLIECGPKCTVSDRCTNKRFQTHQNADCTIFRTEKKGYGLVASTFVPAGTFIMEYVGEVLNSKQFEKRAIEYSKLMNAHYYFMALSSDRVIDATKRGNISRFINHSCNPNAETQKWTVNGELRIGFFSTKDILPDEEITFDYQFQRYGKEAQRCFCEAHNCRGWIGGEPTTDDEEEEDDDDEESEEDLLKLEKDELRADDSSKENIIDEQKRNKAGKAKNVKDPTKKRVRRVRAKPKSQTDKVFKQHLKTTSAEIREDPDLEKEIEVLAGTGLKNQAHTLQLSRLCVRAKLLKAKSELLMLLREGDEPCKRLFLDYRGLKLLHSWMDDFTSNDRLSMLKFRHDILQTLEILPIPNRTTLQDSKVYQCVQRWGKESEYKELLEKLIPPSGSANESPVAADSGSATPTSTDDVNSPKTDDSNSNGSTPVIPFKTEPNDPPTTALVDSATDNVIVKEETAIEWDAAGELEAGNSLGESPRLVEPTRETLTAEKDDNENAATTISETGTAAEDPSSDSVKDTQPDSGVNSLHRLIDDVLQCCKTLLDAWNQLPESFRIPKKMRLEQMKEHEREADQGYKQALEVSTPHNAAFSTRFEERFHEREKERPIEVTDSSCREKDPRHRSSRYKAVDSNFQKMQRRQMFEARFAQVERKRNMYNPAFEARCNHFKLDPRKTSEENLPYCYNVTTGQWYAQNMSPIPTPSLYANIVPPTIIYPTDPNEYFLPPLDLPDHWKYAVNNKGQIYYYHEKILRPQWDPPPKLLPLILDQAPTSDVQVKLENVDVEEEEANKSDEDEEELMDISSLVMDNRLLNLKSDPDLEDNVEDESSASESDDDVQDELESRYSALVDCTQEYKIAINKKSGNLHEEIAAMAEPSTSSNTTTFSTQPNPDTQVTAKRKAKEPPKKKKNREKLVEEFRISPLSDELRRELRMDARKYKENKAKLRRQREQQNTSKNVMPRPKKLIKLTDGIPVVPKVESTELEDNYLFVPISQKLPTIDVRKAKNTAFDSPTASTSAATASSPNSITHRLVSKLPSVGHKFVPDAKELIMKNASKTVALLTPIPTTTAALAVVPSTPPAISSSSASTSSASSSSTSSSTSKKRGLESSNSTSKSSSKRKKTSTSDKIKDKFRSDISHVIVKALRPYFAVTCNIGRIQCSEDFKYLARKLTHFVMLKELKHCANVNLLEVTDSVKGKAREYIRKYMSKFGAVYSRSENEADFRSDDMNID